MSKKKSAYRPRAIMSPWASFQVMPKSLREQEMLTMFSAIDAIARGEDPGVDDWRALSDALNTVEMLMEHREIDCEHEATTQAAISAMVHAADRYKSGKGMRMSGPELQAMRDVLALYEACLERKTWMVMHRARQAVAQRVRDLKSRKAVPEGVTAL